MTPPEAPRDPPPADDRIVATYVLRGDLDDVRARARDLCVEQTVEVTESLCADPFIAGNVVASIEGIEPAGGDRWAVRVGFPTAVATDEIPQLFSMLFGNISLKSGLRLESVELPEAYARRFRGPALGVSGLRRRLGVPGRPLLASALKPVGRSPAELAAYAGAMARGGIDLIKDDHGITDQAWAPFDERVRRCADAVASANAATGGNTLYLPCVNAPADRVMDRCRHAAACGCGGVLVSPFVVGLDVMRRIAADTGLVVMSHPALAGAFLPREDHGIAAGVLFGTLMRLAGADLVVFPSWGGRFPVTRDDCAAIDRGLKAPLGGIAQAMPVPAGGLTLDRVSALRALFGDDVAFLIGSALYERSPDLAANARYFRSLVDAPDRPEKGETPGTKP